MKLTDDEVRASLDALRAAPPTRRAPVEPTSRRATVPGPIVAYVAGLSDVRSDALRRARPWVDGSATLSSDELARVVVGRIVSERVR